MGRAETRAGATGTGLPATVADHPETSVAACVCDLRSRVRTHARVCVRACAECLLCMHACMSVTMYACMYVCHES